MLSLTQKIAFLVFAAAMLAAAVYAWTRLYRRLAAGRRDTDARFDHVLQRLRYSLITTLTQRRTFRKRPVVSFFHSFIFYGFTFYILVNFIDAAEGFFRFNSFGAIYNLLADAFSALVLIAVVALVLRRFALPSRRDFSFNQRTLLHPELKRGYVRFDSIIVSTFILFHVGSRAVGAGAKLALQGRDRFQPFASLVSHAFSPANAEAWRVFGYWGALGSVLAFLAYFPRSKHIHIFLASAKYAVARGNGSGVLPVVELNSEFEEPQLGASKLEELAWPRLLDAYACIQCNRCQDVCPATATGKSLSPSALEINKRMELNELGKTFRAFESGASSPKSLLQFAMTAEAAWACTTCGACMEVCPVQDEPMLDIIDIRRHQVMIEGDFPRQLQSAFRGMERSNNPWGLGHEKRLDWAEGLRVRTTDENPDPDVLYWVGCAASYDPQAQKTARAFVQLLDHAGVDFAVLGKRECCTGDSARRAGNEVLYQQLANTNVATLNALKPKLIVATCPHCMNSIGKEYAQLGGDYKVVHHSKYLDSLVQEGKLRPSSNGATVAFHDPCYLGRHNGVYDAPRNVLNVLSNSVIELDRNRENSFCCGAGGAQFWKEEEPGDGRISDNRYAEAERRLSGAEDKVLAVGCPFCKSMLDSTPGRGVTPLPIKDIAELLLEGVQRNLQRGPAVSASSAQIANDVLPVVHSSEFEEAPSSRPVAILSFADSHLPTEAVRVSNEQPAGASPSIEKRRPKWTPKRTSSTQPEHNLDAVASSRQGALDRIELSLKSSTRKACTSSRLVAGAPPAPGAVDNDAMPGVEQPHDIAPAFATKAPPRKAWKPRPPRTVDLEAEAQLGSEDITPQIVSDKSDELLKSAVAPTNQRKHWVPKRKSV